MSETVKTTMDKLMAQTTHWLCPTHTFQMINHMKKLSQQTEALWLI